MVSWLPPTWLAFLFMILAFPANLTAGEFSAQMILKDGTKLMPGRISVKDGKMRQEFVDDKGHTVTIVRQDKRLIWILLPWEKTYMEIPLTTKLPGQFLQVPPEALHKRKVGQEKVNGYDTEKYECLIPGGAKGSLRQCYWVAPKLGLPVKMTCAERQVAIEYRQIKEAPQADRLFEVPPGYKKTERLDGMKGD